MTILQGSLDFHLVVEREILIAVEILKIALNNTLQTRDLLRCGTPPKIRSKPHRCRGRSRSILPVFPVPTLFVLEWYQGPEAQLVFLDLDVRFLALRITAPCTTAAGIL